MAFYRAMDPPERVAVVGIGYVGLTLLCALGKAGYTGLGYDINEEKVASVARGVVPFEGGERELEALLAELAPAGKITATTDPAQLARVDAVFIAVETPVDDSDHRPRYHALRAALQTICPFLPSGVLVVVESTIAPGTIHGLVLPALEEATGGQVGRDFFLVHCPERVMPGRLLKNINSYDRVVGGVTSECTRRALGIYQRVTSGTLHPTDAKTAEIVKTAENAYRDVQIAFANELALMCEELGADVFEVRELVNSSPFRNMHLPGAGVGGHCIPKDPWLLVSAMSDYTPRLLPTARAINDGMPLHLAELASRELAAEGRSLTGAIITILGAAYLEGTDDTRNAPALALARHLTGLGVTVRLFDPYVTRLEEYAVSGDDTAIDGSDALILVTAHEEFRTLDLAACARRMRTPVLVDGRNCLDLTVARQAGFRVQAIGKGNLSSTDRTVASAE
ncbi:MAG TPA: nucleotide sugar dehydrogenase [Armatimonadota bacterium]|jgi:UDP-N-acetyl-D-mannosaminuronic acid dehydrogenase